jgi:hypothetical protein
MKIILMTVFKSPRSSPQFHFLYFLNAMFVRFRNVEIVNNTKNSTPRAGAYTPYAKQFEHYFLHVQDRSVTPDWPLSYGSNNSSCHYVNPIGLNRSLLMEHYTTTNITPAYHRSQDCLVTDVPAAVLVKDPSATDSSSPVPTTTATDSLSKDSLLLDNTLSTSTKHQLTTTSSRARGQPRDAGKANRQLTMMTSSRTRGGSSRDVTLAARWRPINPSRRPPPPPQSTLSKAQSVEGDIWTFSNM